MQVIVDQINGFVWSSPLVYLCLGAGLLFSIMTRFVQVRLFREMVRLLFASKASDAGISSFQALAVSLSGRVGTGNIAGVAAAIGFGGPGAIFWMWLVAFLGSSTAYVESVLGQIYKEQEEGEYRGGPAFYFEKALGQKWYAWLFAVTTIVATGLLLPGIQSNAIGNAAELAFGGGATLDTWFGALSTTKLSVAIAVVAILGFIIFGGVKRIAHFTQIVVPLMALGYIVTAVVIVSLNASAIPDIFSLIFKEAFTVQAFAGGAWGVLVQESCWASLPEQRRRRLLGRQTRHLLERGGTGDRTACGGGVRGRTPGATGARTGIFSLRRHAVRLHGNGIHDPDYKFLQRTRGRRHDAGHQPCDDDRPEHAHLHPVGC